MEDKRNPISKEYINRTVTLDVLKFYLVQSIYWFWFDRTVTLDVLKLGMTDGEDGAGQP